jgi:hypothetical protein
LGPKITTVPTTYVAAMHCRPSRTAPIPEGSDQLAKLTGGGASRSISVTTRSSSSTRVVSPVFRNACTKDR